MNYPMQPEHISLTKTLDYFVSLNMATIGTIINFCMLLATIVYVVITFFLWRTALKNQDKIIQSQDKMADQNKYLTLRMIWRSREMIVSRNKASRCWAALPKPFLSDMSIYIEEINGKEAEWVDFSLIAHFMVDVLIEYRRKKLARDELEEGFIEFRWWAPRLRKLYATIVGEERMAENLLELETLVSQTEPDKQALEKELGTILSPASSL